eukprot:38157_1
MAEEKQSTTIGFIDWRVTGNLLQQFKDAKHKDSFYSPQFKTVDGTLWRIQFYPHGNKSQENCSICLECIKLNADKPRIGVNFSFNIDDWVCDVADTFEGNGSTQSLGLVDSFKKNKLNNFVDVMNIKCFVEETMDVSDENTYVEWRVNNHLMQQWKSAKHKKIFWSPSFNAIETKLYLGICPNGRGTEGVVHIWLMSRDEKEIHFGYYIEVEPFNLYQINFKKNKVKKDTPFTHKPPFNLKWNDIQNQSEITIRIKIWETGSIVKNEARLLSDIYSERMMILRRECANLKNENSRLKELNEITNAKLANIAMKEIKSFNAEEVIVISKDRLEKQNEFTDKMNKDEARLNEWKLDSISIENELIKSEQKENMNEANTQLLLDRFMKCKTLCNKQQSRMETVVMYCTELNNIKRILKKERTQCDEVVSKSKKECHRLNAKFGTLQTNRMKLQTQWMNALKEMNQTIDEENGTNEAKCCAANEFNTSNMEAKQWTILYAKCAKLIKQYQLFDEENEGNTQQIMQMFDVLWSQAMKRWSDWQPNDIICWLKYLQIQNELILSNEFDFDFVLNEMIKSKMNGLSFATIDKSDLKTIGVLALDDRQQMYHTINALMVKYPHQNRNASQSVEGQCELQIPNEFICPLTKQIMRDPVKIFDNNTYEKQAIEKYLKEHNKSPVTGEECDDEDHWMLANRKLKEKIKYFCL